jgi:hypothetical protein
MEGNDIAPWTSAGVGAIFDGLIASPPTGGMSAVRNWRHRTRGAWLEALDTWKVHDIALKSLIDCINRRGIQAQLFTFLGYGAEDDIETWLGRKGVSVKCIAYGSAELLAEDLVYNRSITRLFVPSQEIAAVLGPRCTVVSPSSVWNL